MTDDDGVSYAMTEKGWAIAEDIWCRFAFDAEDINTIAESHDMTLDEVAVLMAMAMQGGRINVGD